MKELSGFPVVVEIPVVWGEMDAFGHVNNVVYFRYFESARVAYFEKIKIMEDMKKSGLGPILASTSCQFKAPLTYPDMVSVGSKISKLEENRFIQEYLVVSHNLAKVAAQGEGTIVFYNYQEHKKTSVPNDLKQRILDLEDQAGNRPGEA